MSRLVRSHLVERAPADRLVEVVRDVCGIHAQVMGSAELQLAARVDGITQADVREALWERRALVKTWTLRWTLHIHPADELRLWTAARRAVVGEADHANDSLENVDDVVAAIGDALRGRTLTREELADAVVERARAGAARAARVGLGLLPRQRRRCGRALLRAAAGAEGDVRASGRLARPRVDLGAGSGAARGRRAGTRRPTGRSRIASSGSGSAPVSAPWLTSTSRSPTRRAAAASSVRLLPEYDVYVMGYRDRDAFVPPAVREQIKAHGKGRYEGPAGTPFLLVDGVCAGIWRRRKTAKRIELTVEPARKLTRAERAGVDAEAERIGAFLGLEPRLSVDR